MQIVEIHLAVEDDLASHLKEMRAWLAARSFESSKFSPGSGGRMLRVDFKMPLEAYAFAKRFGGQIVAPCR
jgi:hypothetical protein